MSEERLKYETSPIGPRLIALVIDLVLVVILAVIFTFLGTIDWYFIELIFNFGVEYIEIAPIVFIFMIIISLLVYFIVVPSLTDGQTVGKIVMRLHVVYNDNSSTKKKFSTHTKRLFFIRQGTKVVKVLDERPEGL